MNQIRQNVYIFVQLDRLLIIPVFHELGNVLEIVPQLPVFLFLLLLSAGVGAAIAAVFHEFLYVFEIIAERPVALLLILFIISDIIQ